jgi:hypothetical protein
MQKWSKQDPKGIIYHLYQAGGKRLAENLADKFMLQSSIIIDYMDSRKTLEVLNSLRQNMCLSRVCSV